jgi:TetR/AcrR family transcriptional regulator, regulator of autoinduction and epiphytic fitness
MVRPTTHHQAKRSEIIAAAATSFAMYGYEGTSNKTIAKEGGFSSPALIYHYFPKGKAELFLACIQEHQPLKKLGEMARAEADEPPEIYLRHLAHTYIKLTQEESSLRMIRMVLAEVPRFPELARIVPEQLGPMIFYPVISYFKKQEAAGNIEIKHPTAMVMQFFGPLFLRALFGSVLTQAHLPLPLPTDEEMVESLVETFLHGVRRENETIGKPQEQCHE